jgi:hypothetical protein
MGFHFVHKATLCVDAILPGFSVPNQRPTPCTAKGVRRTRRPRIGMQSRRCDRRWGGRSNRRGKWRGERLGRRRDKRRCRVLWGRLHHTLVAENICVRDA